MPRYSVIAKVDGYTVSYVDAATKAEAAEAVLEGEVAPTYDCSYLNGETDVELAREDA